MARRPTQDIAVGTIFALGLVILSVAVMSIGTDLPWLSQRVSFKVLFPNTDGLMVGAPVRMAGFSGFPAAPGPHAIRYRTASAVQRRSGNRGNCTSDATFLRRRWPVAKNNPS